MPVASAVPVASIVPTTTPATWRSPKAWRSTSPGTSTPPRSTTRGALTLRPPTPTAAYDLGLVRQTQGDLVLAEQLYRRSLANAPDYGPALYNLGILLADQARDDEALEPLTTYVGLNPEDAAGHYRLALVLLALGQIDAGNAELQRVADIDPSILEALPTVAP